MDSPRRQMGINFLRMAVQILGLDAVRRLIEEAYE
tara:strand:- start:430 stop:534 length:105 start_codon:yes stop_codon:yes gene_type:complete